MKKYLPMKSHKWGFKLFINCRMKEFAYNFEVYSGQDAHRLLTSEPDFRDSAKV